MPDELIREVLGYLGGSIVTLAGFVLLFLVIIPARITQATMKRAGVAKATFFRAVAANIVAAALAGVVAALFGYFPILGPVLAAVGYFIGGALGMMLFMSVSFGSAFKSQIGTFVSQLLLAVLLSLIGLAAFYMFTWSSWPWASLVGFVLALEGVLIIGVLLFWPLDRPIGRKRVPATAPPRPARTPEPLWRPSPSRHARSSSTTQEHSIESLSRRWTRTQGAPFNMRRGTPTVSGYPMAVWASSTRGISCRWDPARSRRSRLHPARPARPRRRSLPAGSRPGHPLAILRSSCVRSADT